jgi:hypothetical protein
MRQVNHRELFLQTDLSGISSRARKNPEEREELEKRIELFTAWGKTRGVYKESQATKSWWSVLGKRTPSNYWSDTKGVLGIFDHVSLFLSEDNGKILTSHPYMNYTEMEKETIQEWGREKGLKVLIHPPSDSWYYPEQTSFIEIMKGS